MKKLLSLIAAVFAVLMLVAIQPAGAQRGPQGPFANVIARAECTVDGTDVLVSAMLEQKEKPGSGTYEVGNVYFFLEQKVRGNPKFELVAGSERVVPVNASFAEVAAGEQVEVVIHAYEEICLALGIDPNANAVRAVVEIQVLNANPNRAGGLIHTGRCSSFPNPCR